MRIKSDELISNLQLLNLASPVRVPKSEFKSSPNPLVSSPSPNVCCFNIHFLYCRKHVVDDERRETQWWLQSYKNEVTLFSSIKNYVCTYVQNVCDSSPTRSGFESDLSLSSRTLRIKALFRGSLNPPTSQRSISIEQQINGFSIHLPVGYGRNSAEI